MPVPVSRNDLSKKGTDQYAGVMLNVTRILIPSFALIIFANIFFIIISVFQGGLFRGWLAKKQPE